MVTPRHKDIYLLQDLSKQILCYLVKCWNLLKL